MKKKKKNISTIKQIDTLLYMRKDRTGRYRNENQYCGPDLFGRTFTFCKGDVYFYELMATKKGDA